MGGPRGPKTRSDRVERSPEPRCVLRVHVVVGPVLLRVAAEGDVWGQEDLPAAL